MEDIEQELIRKLAAT